MQRVAVECRHCSGRLDRRPNDRTAAAETNATLPAADGERGRKPDALAHTLVSAAGKRADAHGRMRDKVNANPGRRLGAAMPAGISDLGRFGVAHGGHVSLASFVRLCGAGFSRLWAHIAIHNG